MLHEQTVPKKLEQKVDAELTVDGMKINLKEDLTTKVKGEVEEIKVPSKVKENAKEMEMPEMPEGMEDMEDMPPMEEEPPMDSPQ
ncbi:hypothetical protein [Paludifilum halophilum]|uniref:Uncharacterized protein n=1 Tax=Paludifilum halophilum TaxID=1642702 RepID=A0A235B3Q5_9BACL|nr:hypothetical protein [Paludifilum halophilum]OYD06914.1 hypothetical protein CHM34_13310 [Paludifilum halophilum]